MKMMPFDRNFSMPEMAGTIRPFRSPQVIKRPLRKGEPGAGNWVKQQHELTFLAYRGVVTGDEFRFLTILHDQLYRSGNAGDSRRYLLATYRELVEAMGVSDNHLRAIAWTLVAHGLISTEEVRRGLYRWSLKYDQGLMFGNAAEEDTFQRGMEGFIWVAFRTALQMGMLWVPFSLEPWFVNNFANEFCGPPPLGPDGKVVPGASLKLLKRYGQVRPVRDGKVNNQDLPQGLREILDRVKNRMQSEEDTSHNDQDDSQSVSEFDPDMPFTVRFRES